MFPLSRLLRPRGHYPRRSSSTLSCPLGPVSRLPLPCSRSTVHRTREILPPHSPCRKFPEQKLAHVPLPPPRASPRPLLQWNLSGASTGLQETSGPPRQNRHCPCERWNLARR